MTGMMKSIALITVASTTSVPAAFAATEVADATAALSFWMTWGLVYLAIGVVLMAVATATGLREGREWSSLLSWSATEGETSEESEASPSSRRAA